MYHEATPGFGSQEKSQKMHFPVLPISLAILRVSSMLQSSSSSFHQGGCSGLRLEVGRSSSSSSLFSLVGEMARVSRLDPPVSLRTSGVEGAAGDAAGHPSPNVSSQSRILAPKWVTHHFWEIHICILIEIYISAICRAAPLSINAILPICKGLVAARMTLCAVVNTSHPRPCSEKCEKKPLTKFWRLMSKIHKKNLPRKK